MIIKKSIKSSNNILCDCCNKKYSDTIMRIYEIGADKTFILCKECENQLKNVSTIDTVKKVISVDNNIYY